MDKAQLKDYATTLLFFGVAAVVAYQGQLMGYVPKEYALLALIGFGILSQVAADKRVKAKVEEANILIDQGQAKVEEVQGKVDEGQAKVEEYQKKIDELQAEIAKVQGPKELDAA